MLRVSKIVLAAAGLTPASLRVVRRVDAASDAIQAELEVKDGELHVKLSQEITLETDQRIEITVS